MMIRFGGRIMLNSEEPQRQHLPAQSSTSELEALENNPHKMR